VFDWLFETRNLQVIAISHSGKTGELVEAFPGHLEARDVALLSITGNPDSPLAQKSAHSLHAPATEELLEKIPSRSIIAQEATCNAVVQAMVSGSGFTKELFTYHHPGGAIGGAVK
jgi:D-arabinose 5-phosphate isomerase GutQ